MVAKAKAGLVLEVEGRRAIILTSKGQFERIRLRHPAVVGEYVSLTTVPHLMTSWRLRAGIAGVSAAAVIFLGVLHAIFISPPKAEAYAFVSLDVNPSISLDLNDHMQVLSVEGLNTAGKQVANELHLRGKSLNTAISQIVSEITQEGLMPANNTIVVAAATANDNADASKIQSQAAADVHEALSHLPTSEVAGMSVYSMDISSAVWNEALKEHVSPGKYATYLMAKQMGVPVSLGQLDSVNEQMVLTQLHDLQTGLSSLGSGQYNRVATIVTQAQKGNGSGAGNTGTNVAG